MGAQSVWSIPMLVGILSCICLLVSADVGRQKRVAVKVRQALALPPGGCEILGRSLNTTEPSFPHLRNEDDTISRLAGRL